MKKKMKIIFHVIYRIKYLAWRKLLRVKTFPTFETRRQRLIFSHTYVQPQFTTADKTDGDVECYRIDGIRRGKRL